MQRHLLLQQDLFQGTLLPGIHMTISMDDPLRDKLIDNTLSQSRNQKCSEGIITLPNITFLTFENIFPNLIFYLLTRL